MDYIIMCGGFYEDFEEPKAMSIINGERLVERTIRLLRCNGINNIYISTNNECFNYLGVPILNGKNTYEVRDKKIHGYWLDAYFPRDNNCIYLHGDVYYSENAIKKIIDYNAKENTFIGNAIARNKEHKNWGEPFGWIVVNQDEFRKGIEKTKKLQDDGLLERGYAISWELYRVLNGLNPNIQVIYDNTYLCIDDETSDIDVPFQIEEMNERIRNRSK